MKRNVLFLAQESALPRAATEKPQDEHNRNTTIQNRRIEVPAPANLPDGTKVAVDVTPLPSGKIGIDESEWRDDPAALADWDAWLKTIEPIEWRADDEFDRESRRFNLEAVVQTKYELQLIEDSA